MRYRLLDAEIDEEARTLSRAGALRPIEPRVLDLLLYLARHPGRVASRAELLEQVWPRQIVSDAALSRCVMLARRAVGDAGTGARAIQTVHGRGFRLATRVDRLEGRGLPDALRRLGRVDDAADRRFVGRARELGTLAEAWSRALTGTSGVVVLSGEAGVGKTRLALEFAVGVADAGLLLGRCEEISPSPFQPFAEALRQFVESSTPQALRVGLGPHAGDLVRLLPDLATWMPGLPPPLASDPETERHRLFSGVAGWLEAAARAQPLLIVLDDLHDATTETALLLRHVVQARLRVPLLLVATTREADPACPLARVLPDVLGSAGALHLCVGGLVPEAVTRLVAEVAEARPALRPAGVGSIVHARAGGNPLFVHQILRDLAEQLERAPETSPRAIAASVRALPPAVQAVIARRFEQLSEAAIRILPVAAVIGEEFHVHVLAAASTLDEDTLVEALVGAQTAGLVHATGPGVYRFAHPVVRAALAHGIAAVRRTRLHRRIGEAIEAAFAPDLDLHLGQLAMHFQRAAADGDAGKAVEYTSRAAERARALLAHDEAVQHCTRALALVGDDGPRRRALLLALGAAQRDAGDGSYRTTLLAAAREACTAGDVAALVEAALGNHRGFASAVGGIDAERVAMLEAALSAIGPAPSCERARVLATLASELTFSPERRRVTALASEALDLARRLGNRPTLVHVLRHRYLTNWTPDSHAER